MRSLVFLTILGQALQPVLSQEAAIDIGQHHKLLTNCRHGTFLINKNDNYVGRSLEIYGEWSEEEVILFSKLVKPGDLVLDIGGNIGAFTVPLAKMVGASGTVHTFEPQRVLSHLLAANVALNEIENVVIHNAGVGDQTTPLDVPSVIYSKEANFGSVSLLQDWAGLGAQVEEVPQIRLDDAFHVVGGTCPSLIKIDVEGYESKVITGSRKLLRDCKPVLHVENNCIKGSEELLEAIAAYGYTCHWDVHPYFRAEHNFRQAEASVFFPNQDSYSINVLCFSKDSTEIEMPEYTRIDVENKRYLLHDYNLSMVGKESVVLRQLGTLEKCVR